MTRSDTGRLGAFVTHGVTPTPSQLEAIADRILAESASVYGCRSKHQLRHATRAECLAGLSTDMEHHPRFVHSQHKRRVG